MALYQHTHLGRPTPAHVLTPSAEAARAAVRSLPPSRLVQEVTKRGITMQPARAPLTRREVEEAYVHPEPERTGTEWDVATAGSREGWVRWARFAGDCHDAGAEVKVTVARGTTLPKWHVNAPDSKPNPGPPVDASQYHGDLVDSVVVWARKPRAVDSYFHTKVRAEWHNGRIHEVTVNGAKSSLKAALEALGATT